jgi:hypothetical protein
MTELVDALYQRNVFAPATGEELSPTRIISDADTTFDEPPLGRTPAGNADKSKIKTPGLRTGSGQQQYVLV